MNRKIKALIASVAIVSQGSAAVVAAVPSSQALKAALAKSKLVDPTIEIVSSTEPGHPEHVYISTFMHRSATEDDLKIDALLMSKVVMEAAPDVDRVVVVFFSAADVATYRQVSIKKIDIKAFEGGDVNRAELLKTIEVVPGQTVDSPAKLTALLHQISFVRDLQVGVSGKLIDLSAQVDLSRSDLDTKLEALQLAKNALAAAPEGVEQVNVKLQDAWEAGKSKQVNFAVSDLEKMSSAIEGVLAALAIVPVAAQNKVVAGEYEQDRQKLADRIDALGKLGVNTSAFSSYFKTIEAAVGKENINEPSHAADMIKKLQGYLDDQEKTTASAKNRPSQLKKEPEKVAVAQPTGHTDKHAVFIGDREFDETRARDQPDIYAKELEAHYMPQPNGPAHFVDVLQRISQILRTDQKVADAEKFQKWANEVRARIH
jgi:hypothetical protein